MPWDQPGPSTVGGVSDAGAPQPFKATSAGHLEVAIHEPSTVFGDVSVSEDSPRVQIDFTEGIIDTDSESLTDGSSGSVTNGSSLVTCATGTTVGGYGVLRSKRTVRYRPGQGAMYAFTAMWPDGSAANALLMAGAFNAEDALFVGFSGTTFGFLRRIGGAAHITRLTVSAGAGGVETLTVTLNGVAFTVAAGGVLSTSLTAKLIAERVGGYTGWSSGVSPTANGATVTFIQGTPGTAGGAFTLTSTGTAAGTFATVQTGSANDSTTGFVAKSAGNVDRLDGTGTSTNPTGIALDTTKLNAWRIRYGFLGAASIILDYLTPRNGWQTVHILDYANAYTLPNQKNPTFRLGWVAASLGSTTNLRIQGASAGGFIAGKVVPRRDPFSVRASGYAATTTEGVALAIRVRGEFSTRLCQRAVDMHHVVVANETSNRILVLRVVVNPTYVGSIVWGYVDQTRSAMEYSTTTGVTITGGREVGSVVVTTNANIDLHELDLRLEAGDTVALCVATVSSTATAAVSVNWNER